MKVCRKCQRELVDGAKFCYGCGASADDAIEYDMETVSVTETPAQKQKKGSAAIPVILILVCFALVAGILVYWLKPEVREHQILPVVTREGDAPRREVAVPKDGTVRLNLQMEEARYGNVVMIENKDGSFSVVPETVWTETGVQVLLKQSCTLIVVDKSIDFSDVPEDHWTKDAVDYLSARGLIEPVEGDMLYPGNPLTRKEMAMLLWKIAGRPRTDGKVVFQDVTQPEYLQAVSYMAQSGISVGYGDGTFHPDEPVSRQHFIVMLYRFANYTGCRVSAENNKTMADFTDGDQVFSWAVEAMEWAVNNGIISGGKDGSLNPNGNTSNAQAYVMLLRFLQKYYAQQ